MKLIKKITTVVFSLCLAFTCITLSGCKNKNYTKNNTKFVIGATGPLTGGAAVYGQGVKNAAQMAVDEINAAGGIDGILFEFNMLDDQHDASKVESLYNSLYEDGMQVSIGTVTSAPGKVFKTLSHDDNVFFITPSATADEITDYDNGYQMCFSDSGQGTGAAGIVNEKYPNGTTIGIFYKSDDIYSKGLYDNFIAAKNSNINVVTTSFTDSNSTDFSSQIQQLKDCTFIFMPIYYTPASLFMTQWNEASNTTKDNTVTFFGCDGFDGIENVENFNVNNIPEKITMLSHFNSTATTGAAGTFISKYTEKYGTDTLTQFGASAYDCVYAIYYAMKEIYEADSSKLPVTISASDLCDLLKAKFATLEFENGVTGNGGTITWNSDGSVSKSAIQYPINNAAKGTN